MEWGVCTTVKAPLDQILAFVAWYKHLGAARIWVHLDDPDHASLHILGQIDGVVSIACDDAYWAGRRPKSQEGRQVHNLRRIYGSTDLPMLAHVDVDEFLYSAAAISDILDAAPPDAPFVRAAPAEALHDPSLPADIFTARQFRKPFAPRLGLVQKQAVLGEYAEVLAGNMLSHRVGKSLFRTGLDGFLPRIHAGSFSKDGPPLNIPANPDITVLHFHAQDRAAWRDALPHRVSKGAYSFNVPLAAYLAEASSDQIEAFYDATQVATPQLVAALTDAGLLVEADLRLKEEVAALF